jgi:hypothetical protein
MAILICRCSLLVLLRYINQGCVQKPDACGTLWYGLKMHKKLYEY